MYNYNNKERLDYLVWEENQLEKFANHMTIMRVLVELNILKTELNWESERFYLDKEQLMIQTRIDGNFADELSILVYEGELEMVTECLAEFI